MSKGIFFLIAAIGSFFGLAAALSGSAADIIRTSQGDLKISLLGHATLRFEFNGKVIDVDPVGSSADYHGLPKADVILVTHAHSDHLDPAAIDLIKTARTDIILTAKAAEKVQGAVMKNGDQRTVQGIPVEAVPAYNIVHMRSANVPYHPKGDGNGYILTFGNVRVYVAGDTENTPEMKALKSIDVAFLPMNLPYTMTPEMVADAVKAFRPKIVYPYHYSGTDPQALVNLLKGFVGVEVRVRKIY
jgi:L-ascorbate metabolism protein UlaG (beta-lactamase superfamily)